MPLYTVTVNGIPHTIDATEEQARRYRNARPADDTHPAPEAKARAPRNKARTARTKAAK
ncbi:hypothetical protein [Tomitella fengzijianii]|uniref:hypothetical protein n=1 Tax=Tomitella fengzijianii TaxID=2597660 RepID=UPI00143CD767|nr:hypothetical protein [Tomitella fengzijianii]